MASAAQIREVMQVAVADAIRDSGMGKSIKLAESAQDLLLQDSPDSGFGLSDLSGVINTAGKAALVGIPGAVLAAIGFEKFKDRRQSTLTRLVTEHPGLRYLPGAAVGVALGAYYGEKAKQQRDQLGLPYNVEFGF